MIANAARIMPASLKVEVDQRFFERGLDGVDVVAHGRHSHEQQARSHLRRRLILTRRVAATAADPSNEKALLWNPSGASLEEALTALGAPDGSVGVIGGADVFAAFLDRYSVFYLSQVTGVRLPGASLPRRGFRAADRGGDGVWTAGDRDRLRRGPRLLLRGVGIPDSGAARGFS